MDPILNRALLSHNTCFGCGLENPAGLQIEITRDPERADRLAGVFHTTEGMAGFPGIVHGGTIFTALDCLSTWVSALLGPNRGAAWLLRSATAVYHRPAPAGKPLRLAGWIQQSAGPWDSLLVVAEAYRSDGELCVSGEFKVIPVPQDRFREIAELEEIPENWRAFLTPE
jgi:acyl-coenzyme A thioesterase PaaI-like protein